MRATVAALVLVSACGSSKPAQRPVVETPKTPEPVATAPKPDMPRPVPPPPPDPHQGEPAPPPPPEKPSLIAKLPKAADFVTPLSTAKVDAAKAKEGKDLFLAALALHKQKDYAGAKDKYAASLAANPGDLIVRYDLAGLYALSGETDKALAMLLELEVAPDCAACADVAEHTRWDDDWRAEWSDPAMWEVLHQTAPTPEGNGDEGLPADDAPLVCPKGTTLKGKWDPDKDYNEQYCVKGGVKHGPYRLREQGYDMGEGTRSANGSYVDGKKDGLWGEFESYGTSYDGAYVKGVRHGLTFTFHKDESGVEVYVEGKLDGRVQTSAEDHVILDAWYEQGALHGAYKTWYRDPYQPQSAGSYDHGKKHGAWIEYDENGKQRATESWDHGVASGVFTYYDAAGKPLAQTTITAGTGDWIEYDLAGNKVAQGHLADGAREGHWTFADGEGDYEKGKREGVWVRFDKPGGAKLAEGPYKADKRQGVWTFWHEDGTTILAKGRFADDKVDGAWTVYDDKGEQAQALVFQRGKLVKVDGARASGDYQRGWSLSGAGFPDRPEPIQPMEKENMPPGY